MNVNDLTMGEIDEVETFAGATTRNTRIHRDKQHQTADWFGVGHQA